MVPGLCLNGKCISLPRGYRCMCNVGYKLTMDGKRCLGEASFLFSLIKSDLNTTVKPRV